ncbi:MAG: nucleotide exchange factor GrpE [Alistipes sp.]|nr:nucleotide exchange factor GrpE [Alistipes sp.]MDE6778174.1 nucleotide exchange factor GrpE [Alistipes sp.]MDE6858094.1 nucleotide exchange factor GrpE [Alistipes sp.]
MAKEQLYNEEIGGDDNIASGDGAATCGDEPCANVADETAAASDTMTEPDGEEQPKDASAEASEWRDKYVRLHAEFDNYRKRTLREKMDLVQSGGADVLKAMLPVVDDVNRALDAMEKSDDVAALRDGVRLIAMKFDEVLRSKGVTEIEAKGQELDVDRHEAVAKFAAGEENKGKIIDVVQRGYMLGDKVLRFAKVVVGD